MSALVLIDTVVYLNILNIPENNQDRDSVLNDFEVKINNGDQFLLPLATIFETGNHISDLNNGGHRYKYAGIMVADVCKALKGDLNGTPPYIATPMPSSVPFAEWINTFPNYAKLTKMGKKKKEEGVSLSDFTIIKEWEKQCAANPFRHVLIWSLDSDLSSYNRLPQSQDEQA